MTRPSAAPTVRAVTRANNADADLLAAGYEVETLVVKIEALRALWPMGETAIRRAGVGRALDTAYTRLADLYGAIAVKLRRVWPGSTARTIWSAGWWNRPSP